MTERVSRRKPGRSAAIAVAGALLLIASGGSTSFVSGQSASETMEMRQGRGAATSTPVAARADDRRLPEGDPLDGDPLDGDPLDGHPSPQDAGAPDDHAQLDVVRSGRPNGAPRSVTAYDGDAETVWTPGDGSDTSWLWLDLGTDRRVRAVRWLATGQGSIQVSVSRDRRRWREVDRVDAGRTWRGVELRDDARYVRLELLPDDAGAPPAIAEVAVYGSERADSVSIEQETGGKTTNKKTKQRNRDRVERKQKASATRRQDESAREPEETNGSEDSEERANGRVRVSSEAGETRCKGKRARCEARQGEVSVEEDCEREGSCTIDIRADGGAAICDASGGERSRAGRGEGKRGADGGECEAVANGGAVAVGDFDP